MIRDVTAGRTALAFLAAFLFFLDIGIASAFERENTGGAIGDGIADDTAALQSVLDRGDTVVLSPGRTYRITRRLDIRHDNSGLRGDGTGTLLMDPSPGAFDNVTDYKYGEDAVGIHASGVAGIRIEGLRIRYDRNAEDRIVKAIALRQCADFRIAGNDIAHFTKADGIVYVGACRNGVITGNVIHSSYTNSKTRGQITGIVLDDDDQGSSAIEITDNDIRDLEVGHEFLAAYNYQTDAINLTTRTRNVVVSGNRILNVGEGIDSFATSVRIAGNNIENVHAFGIKLIHGASDTVVSGNTIRRAGMGGIVISGSPAVSQDTAGNVIEGNTIIGVNMTRAADRFTTFGIGIVRGGGTAVTGTRVIGNTVRTGKRGAFGILVESGSGHGNEVSGNTVSGGRVSRYRIDPAAAPGADTP